MKARGGLGLLLGGWLAAVVPGGAAAQVVSTDAHLRLGIENVALPAGETMGLVGTSYLLAIISPDKKELGRDMDAGAAFASASANTAATRTLVIEATGASGGSSGRFGASAVVAIREVQ